MKWINMNCLDNGDYYLRIPIIDFDLYFDVYLFSVKFLMNTDDHAFVNVPNLVHVLLGGTVPVYNATLDMYDQQNLDALNPVNRMQTTENLLIGSRFSQVKPERWFQEELYLPRYLYDNDFYPDYVAGAGYVMSIDVATKLYAAALAIPLIHLDDVYLTGNYHLLRFSVSIPNFLYL